MAQSSGIVEASAATNTEFSHSKTGARYQILQQDGRLLLRVDGADREMRYFVGSGAAARSYILLTEGYLYQAPMAFYSSTQAWNLAPGYDRYAYPFLSRAIVPGCLQCHASGVQVQPGAFNRYSSPPFAESGISCERCHGPGAAHVSDPRKAIVNPAKLPAARRDSVCAQCHLSGAVRVIRKGRRFDSFVAGDLLSDHVAVFVRNPAARRARVTSHVEDLARSRCKQVSGDRLWCGSCHDSHRRPGSGEKATWFRAKCVSCHSSGACRAAPAARNGKRNDCAACHMPRGSVVDAEHVVLTDHSIPRLPGPAPGADGGELIPFDGSPPSQRDLGLAYAMSAPPSQPRHPDAVRAFRLLRGPAPDDSEAISYLAVLHRARGEDTQAIRLFEASIALDSAQLTGFVELGSLQMERGETAKAMRLWRVALAKNPALTLVRTNLALALLRSGDRTAAERELRIALSWEPAHPVVRRILRQLGLGLN